MAMRMANDGGCVAHQRGRVGCGGGRECDIVIGWRRSRVPSGQREVGQGGRQCGTRGAEGTHGRTVNREKRRGGAGRRGSREDAAVFAAAAAKLPRRRAPRLLLRWLLRWLMCHLLPVLVVVGHLLATLAARLVGLGLQAHGKGGQKRVRRRHGAARSRCSGLPGRRAQTVVCSSRVVQPSAARCAASNQARCHPLTFAFFSLRDSSFLGAFTLMVLPKASVVSSWPAPGQRRGAGGGRGR